MTRGANGLVVVVFCGLLGLMLATQSIASQLNYADGLGSPVVELFGISIYSPLSFLSWYRDLSHYAPSVLHKSLWYFAVPALMSFPLVIGLSKVSDKKLLSSSKIFGSATWARFRDIKRMGLLESRGVFLGKLKGGRTLRHDGPEHYAIIAPTRSGKGAGVVIPTLLHWRESVLVHDIKGENWKNTAGHRAEFSHVIYFNPNSRSSAHFNPLLEVRKGILEVRDVQNIADMIVDPDGSGFSDHWIKTGHSLLVATILHVLYAGEPEEKNLAGVARFLSNPEKNILGTLNEMLTATHFRAPNGDALGTHPVVAAAARDMLNKSENERSGVLSTAMSFLTLYRDPIIAHNTRDSDFKISDLVSADKPVSLYLIVPPSDLHRLRPLVRLMVNQICRRLTEEHESAQRKHRLLLMLDEFPTLGKLDFFETALGFIAGYGLKAMLICQCLNQLKKSYGEKNSILDNTHVRLFYAPNTLETAEYVSRSLGQSTVSYKTLSESGRKLGLWRPNENSSTHFVGRALLTPGEVLELGEDDAIAFFGGNSPIRCKKIRYYKDRSMVSLVKAEPTLLEDSPYAYGPPKEMSPWLEANTSNAELLSELAEKLRSYQENAVPDSDLVELECSDESDELHLNESRAWPSTVSDNDQEQARGLEESTVSESSYSGDDDEFL